MQIDKHHRITSLLPQAYKLLRRWQLGSWGVGERTVSNRERWWWRCHTSTRHSAAWQSQCPWASPDLSSHGASSQTQTPCCSALHHLKQAHNWFGLLFLKKTRKQNVSMFCIIYKQNWVYLGWRLCTLYLLACQVSYHRWFRSLLCSWDRFWVLINCFCWFLAKVPVKSTMTTVALFDL